MHYRNYNFLLLQIISPLLIMIGLAGYFLPKEHAYFCIHPYYNLVHINAGMIGYIILFSSSGILIRIYNIALGGAMFYQAIASFVKIFPGNYFQYTIIDDLLNVDLGLLLLLAGMVDKRISKKREVSLP